LDPRSNSVSYHATANRDDMTSPNLYYGGGSFGRTRFSSNLNNVPGAKSSNGTTWIYSEDELAR
jgi:hypothetical protein